VNRLRVLALNEDALVVTVAPLKAPSSITILGEAKVMRWVHQW